MIFYLFVYNRLLVINDNVYDSYGVGIGETGMIKPCTFWLKVYVTKRTPERDWWTRVLCPLNY